MDFDKLVDRQRGGLADVPGGVYYPALRKTSVGYTARATSGRAKVKGGYFGGRGPWVVLVDTKTGRELTVRPGQVSA